MPARPTPPYDPNNRIITRVVQGEFSLSVKNLSERAKVVIGLSVSIPRVGESDALEAWAHRAQGGAPAQGAGARGPGVPVWGPVGTRAKESS